MTPAPAGVPPREPLPAPGALFLVGYRGTGKSTVGRLLAQDLRVPFIDTDLLVEEALGSSIAECFARQGEAAFRVREREALGRALEAARSRGAVVATGGGLVTRADNVTDMRRAGRVVWLSARPETIRARLAADPRSGSSRPPLAGRSLLDEVEAVLTAREPLYRAAAHLEVSTEGQAPEETASRIISWLKSSPPLADPWTCRSPR